MARRYNLSLILGILLAASSSAFAPAPVYREPPKSKVPDLSVAIQGTWEVEQPLVNVNVAIVRRGNFIRRTPQPIRISGTSWAYIFTNNGVETETTKYRMVLDTKATPPTLDLKHTVLVGVLNGPAVMSEQIVLKGIVRVDGDMLTFCYVPGTSAARPKQFLAGNQVMPDGTIAQTLRLKRIK